MLGDACTWHDRFIRQVSDKLSEQERAFREELEKGASAREGFRKVTRSLLPPPPLNHYRHAEEAPFPGKPLSQLTEFALSGADLS